MDILLTQWNHPPPPSFLVSTFSAAPFKNTQQTQIVHLQNDADTPLAFKVKTTAPRIYCVRPNSGVLQPGATENIAIIFQGLTEEPQLGSKCKDKFLFVGVPCDGSIDPKHVSTSWNELTEGKTTSDTKVKVVFNYDSPMNTITEEKSVRDEPHPATTIEQAPRAVEAVEPIQRDVERNVERNVERPVERYVKKQVEEPAQPSAKAPVESVHNSVKKVQAVEPPSVATQVNTTGTNQLYMYAIVALIVAFILSRLV